MPLDSSTSFYSFLYTDVHQCESGAYAGFFRGGGGGFKFENHAENCLCVRVPTFDKFANRYFVSLVGEGGLRSAFWGHPLPQFFFKNIYIFFFIKKIRGVPPKHTHKQS